MMYRGYYRPRDFASWMLQELLTISQDHLRNLFCQHIRNRLGMPRRHERHRRHIHHPQILNTVHSSLRINYSPGVIPPPHRTRSTGMIQRDGGIADVGQDISIFHHGWPRTQVGADGQFRNRGHYLPQPLERCHGELSIGARDVGVPA